MEEENNKPPIQSTPYQAPMYNFGTAIIQLTNPEQELYKLELMLRNKMIDSEGNEKQIGKPVLNEEGICSVMGQVHSIVNQVTVMSSLDKKREMPQLLDYLADSLAKDLMINRIRYDLNAHDRSRIYSSIISLSMICMKRASVDELSDKKFWRGSVQEINTQSNVQKKSGNILSRAMGWAK